VLRAIEPCRTAAPQDVRVQSAKPENAGIYAASLAKPGERVRLLLTETDAV
jgi:hypothetical protein